MSRVVEESIDARHCQHLVELLQRLHNLRVAKVHEGDDFEVEALKISMELLYVTFRTLQVV